MNYPFQIELFIFRRPHMRDESLEYELYVGRKYVDNIFDREEIDTKTTTILLSFPERWMNIVEERSLYDRVALLYPNLKLLTIKTQSVYLIQSTAAANCTIVTTEEEQEYIKEHGQLPQEQKTGKMWFTVPMNIVNAKGLTVIGGDHM